MPDNLAAPPPPDPAKPVTQSMTIQGALVTLIGAFGPVICAQLGLTQGQLVADVGAVVTLAGAVMAIIGRMRATKRLA